MTFDGSRALLAHKLLQWRAAGTLLVLVSNNDDDSVRAVLDRSDSPLRAEHFSVISTGWDPKPDRIGAAAAELQLALSDVVYLDDNPVEVARVRFAYPEVLAVTCPPEGELPAFLLRLWPFIPDAVTAEDTRRADYYRQQGERDAARAKLDFATFMNNLNLDVTIVPLTADTTGRAQQIIRRTSQFTLGPTTEADLDHWRITGEVWTASARDRFGDYGTIAVLAVQADGDTLRVPGWHLSCRALGRGVEQRLLGWLADRATVLGCTTVHLTVARTARNVPARRLVAALVNGDSEASTIQATLSPDALRAQPWEG